MSPEGGASVDTMITTLLGKKVGMTRVFDEKGAALPVTVLEIGPCLVMQVKDQEKDGYCAVQIGFGRKKRARANKPETGHAKKASVEPATFVREVRLDSSEGFAPGQELTLKSFEKAARVTVTGWSKGRGFTGVMKRWNFRGQKASHGVSKVHRRPGSIGQSADPSRVLKGTKMPGRKGVDRTTVKNLDVARVDEENNLLLVKGAVPGPNGGYVIVRLAGERS
jgi:large subunit ribosomal protein L3